MLLVRNKNQAHASQDIVREFEDIIIQTPKVRIVNHHYRWLYIITYNFFRIFRKLNININLIPNVSSVYKDNIWGDSGHLFTVMLGLNESKFHPYIITRHNKSIYLFDAWPSEYIKIQKICRTYKINYLFVSSSQSANNLQALLPETQVFWIPEGINPDEYRYRSFQEKDIDVLALGRRYDKYHHAIVSYLEENQYSYLYEQEKGKIIFPTREGFINGLARAKISICVPSSITHPDRSGDIETMTVRYLQSIASKCLIVGHAPQEMITLFGYNPVIEIDEDNPTKQLEDILKNYSSYFPLIEKNFQQVQYHTWKNRWEQIKKTINKQKN
ncbi:hypothetical protein AGMMS50262_14040 [Bacteroidia bacterium]|nr:hypothetical protein AGMMS50262_14040 [Bacteroidia bacterium]